MQVQPTVAFQLIYIRLLFQEAVPMDWGKTAFEHNWVR